LESLLPEIVDPAYRHRLMVSDIRESSGSTALSTPIAKKKLFKFE